MDSDGNPISRTTERLDVEDEEDRQNRIQSFLEKLNSRSTKAPISSSFDMGSKTTHAVNPPTELLSRVQAFLPQLEASNGLLANRLQADPKSVDIEHIEEGGDQYIEMNLGLGVFEGRSDKAREAQDAEMSTSSSSDMSESEDDSDFDSDSSSEIITSFHPVRPIKPLPKRQLAKASPRIVVLGGRS